MRAVTELTQVLDRIYAPDEDLSSWLKGVHRAVHEGFEGHLGVATYVLRLSASAIELEGLAADDGAREQQLRMAHGAASNDIGYLYGTAPVLRAGRIVPPDHPLMAALDAWGVPDMLTGVGTVERSTFACILFVMPSREARIPRATSSAVARLGAHFASSYRLRARRDLSIAELEQAEAVLTPRGAVVHAAGAAKNARARAPARSGDQDRTGAARRDARPGRGA
jgi:hypothetical protein